MLVIIYVRDIAYIGIHNKKRTEKQTEEAIIDLKLADPYLSSI